MPNLFLFPFRLNNKRMAIVKLIFCEVFKGKHFMGHETFVFIEVEIIFFVGREAKKFLT